MPVVTIVFEDGSKEPVNLRIPDMVQAERHFKGEIPPLEGTLWAAWKKLKPGPPFDVWVETVDAVEHGEAEDQAGPLEDEAPPAT